MTDYKSIKIGSTDYWDVLLKRMGDKIMLKRYHPLDYGYMQQYIDDNIDMLSEWQNDVYHWNTEQGYDEWRENYEYEYSDYFRYDSEEDEYYDEDDSDTTWDYFYPSRENDKETIVDLVMDYFHNDYQVWNFDWYADMNEQVIREKIGQYYDECVQYTKELEEKRKPHWNAFSYYK